MNQLELLFDKIGEHIQCCIHMNMRGIGETKSEMADIVKQAKKDGQTFADFKALVLSKGAPEEMFEKDALTKDIKKMFEVES